MLLNTAEFKRVCSTVLTAADGSELSALTETLELKTKGNILHLNVTNKEYYLSVAFQLDHEEPFHAAVNANLFLKLIAAITADTVEMICQDTYLEIKANGNYKLPYIYENDVMINVPEIIIENKTVEMEINKDILESIVNYNGKQLAIGSVSKPVQRMFYIDEQGCITFTAGACVNKFELAQPVKVLLNSRLVSLFRLFKDPAVKFTLGYDPISETLIQTKVSFETSQIKLSAKTACNDELLNQVPVNLIRGRAYEEYTNNIVFNTAALKEAINRLLLFSAGYGSKETLKPYSKFIFNADNVTIYDSNNENNEVLTYQNGSILPASYEMILDASHLKRILDTCSEEYITMNFGNRKACVITRSNIKNIMSEVRPRSIEVG